MYHTCKQLNMLSKIINYLFNIGKRRLKLPAKTWIIKKIKIQWMKLFYKNSKDVSCNLVIWYTNKLSLFISKGYATKS